MAERFDVIVLGLGGMGSAAAFELARRGRRVLGLEQFRAGHDRGSSHGLTRVIRKAYYEHADYVPLLRRAYDRWYDLEQRRGQHLFTRCGCLSIGTPEGELVPGVLRAALEHDLPLETLDSAALRHVYPQFQFGEDSIAVLERDAGFLAVENCVLAHAEEARRLGADLREEEPVRSWSATPQGVEVRTERGVYQAGKLVVTAGAWASTMLADLGLPLKVLRKVLFWFGTSQPQRLRRDLFPIYMAEMPQGFYYGFPVLDPLGHKAARHDGGEIVAHPSQLEKGARPGEEDDCRAFLRASLPLADGPVTSSRACMYTMTPDHHFILDVHPHSPHIALAAGFSGHGFKFATVVGEILADLADAGHTALPIGRFRLDRFPEVGRATMPLAASRDPA